MNAEPKVRENAGNPLGKAKPSLDGAPADWRGDILRAGLDLLDEPGAVIIRMSRMGAEPVSRVYPASDYDSTQRLRRVAVTRMSRLLNADQAGWNYYSVIRYAGGELVAWTGMHSVLAEASCAPAAS